MKRYAQHSLFAALLAASVSAASMGAALAQGAPAPTAAAPAAAAPAGDPVLVTVNGSPIRQSELNIALEDIGSGLPPEVRGPARDEYVLSFLTDMTLLAKAAEAQKIDQTPEFQNRLAYARTKALMEALMMQEAKKAVSAELKRKTYDELVKSAPADMEVHARHILVDDEAKAKDIAKRAKAGEDFAKLAKENSKDSAEDGGDLGYFTKDQMVPEFAEAAFKLEKGQVSDPVKTQFGWHIIKVEDKRSQQPPAFDAVKEEVKSLVIREKYIDLVKQIRAAGKVEVTDPTLKKAIDAIDASK